MAVRKNGRKFSTGKINALVKWKKRPSLDEMIDDHVPVKDCVAWCKENGFSISLPTMYIYIKRRNEAIVNGLTFELLQPKLHEENMKRKAEGKKKGQEGLKEHGLRGAATIKENYRKERARTNQALVEVTEQETKECIRHDMELLDEIVQKGFDTLKIMEVISPATAIKAIEMKNKLSNGSTGGYTMYGLEEIKLREAAREQAIISAILEFIPEEKHVAVIERMEQVTKEYYESICLGEAYEKAFGDIC